ncbi:MAG: ThiF family adenylyltransferase [bacterium]|nr:ThiF family adenylyltransferase [bacterium]
MKKLKKIINKMKECMDKKSYKPIIFNLKKIEHKNKVTKLIAKKQVVNIIDEIDEQVKELYLLRNPEILGGAKATHKKKYIITDEYGLWVFYPWKSSLVHILNKKDFRDLRISRNKNLITEVEQQSLEKCKLGIVGMNVGNSAALCMALEGVGLNVKFADLDHLSVSNMNRFNGSLTDLGISKVILSARQVSEINPFVKVSCFNNGITPKNIEAFILKPKVDIIIEEMDNLPLKIEVRKYAKKYKVPVIMVTGNGPNLILDVERYDIDKNLQILNGTLPDDVVSRIFNEAISYSPRQKAFLARDFIGKKYVIKKLNESFDQFGISLAGIPQLAEATFLRGALLSYCVRQICLKKGINSGRYKFSMEDVLLKSIN